MKCPHCLQLHDHEPQPGHHVALCDDRGIGIVVSDRHFIPNCGYTICECKEVDRVNELISPDDVAK